MHPSIDAILRHFDYDHLPPELAAVSKRFHALAHELASECSGPETTVALRKLLESKDAAVRAHRTELINRGLDERAMGGRPGVGG